MITDKVSATIAIRDQCWSCLREPVLLAGLKDFLSAKFQTESQDKHAVIVSVASVVLADLALIDFGSEAGEPSLARFHSQILRVQDIAHGYYTADDLPFICELTEAVISVIDTIIDYGKI